MFLFGSGTLKIRGRGVMVKDLCPMHTFPPAFPPASFANGQLKPVRTPVAIFGSLGVCIYGPSSRHGLISYSPIHLT